jgi:peptide methionine sulfoxide reductase MsrA
LPGAEQRECHSGRVTETNPWYFEEEQERNRGNATHATPKGKTAQDSKPGNTRFATFAEGCFWGMEETFRRTPGVVNTQVGYCGGPDVGTQYRSAIYYHGEAQKAEAQASKERRQASGKRRRPIVTEITPASVFYRAEEYHQRYLAKRGMDGCHL